jgi:hypothetical protein
MGCTLNRTNPLGVGYLSFPPELLLILSYLPGCSAPYPLESAYEILEKKK